MGGIIMHIKIILIVILLSFPLQTKAMDMKEMMKEEQSVFHSFALEADAGVGRKENLRSWDFNGWIGGDFNKLWIKSEGEVSDDHTEQAEIWAMYSRNVAEFWDIQVGIRQDIEPNITSFLVIGTEGLARYFFETEAHLFLSDEGNVSARIRQENDFLLTQKFILQPYAELNIYAQDVSDYESGAGIATGEIGLQTRYEITKKFAPYIDVRYESKFGETAKIAKSSGELQDDAIINAGIRLRF